MMRHTAKSVKSGSFGRLGFVRSIPTSTVLTDIKRLIAELTAPEKFPVSALLKADADRDRLVPAFLDEIERHLSLDANAAEEPTALFFMFHLLGSWAEKKAYRPLAQLLRLPPQRLHHILGDAVAVTSHRVMLNVFDGDPGPLQEIILDLEADAVVRDRMLEALAILTLRQQIPLDDTAAFLRSCFHTLLPQTQSVVWVGWQSAIAMLGLSEIKLLVKQAFDRGLIDTSILTYDHFNKDLQKAIEGYSAADADEYKPFGSAVQELAGWSSYR